MTSDRHAEALRAAQCKTFGADALAGTDVLAARDASQFAATIKKPGEALRQFHAAELRGDTSLSVAIGARAWEMRNVPGGGWQPVLAAFAGSSKERNANLFELTELTGAAEDSSEAA